MAEREKRGEKGPLLVSGGGGVTERPRVRGCLTHRKDGFVNRQKDGRQKDDHLCETMKMTGQMMGQMLAAPRVAKGFHWVEFFMM